MYLVGVMSIQTLCLFLRSFVILLLSCNYSLYFLGTDVLSDITVCRNVLPFCGLSFHFISFFFFTFLTVPFEAPKGYSFWCSPIYLAFGAWASGVLSEKPLLNPQRWRRYKCVFSSKSFLLLALTFGSLIYFESTLMVCDVGLAACFEGRVDQI